MRQLWELGGRDSLYYKLLAPLGHLLRRRRQRRTGRVGGMAPVRDFWAKSFERRQLGTLLHPPFAWVCGTCEAHAEACALLLRAGVGKPILGEWHATHTPED